MLKGLSVRDGRCVLELGDARFEVDAAAGARIVSARGGGLELLAGRGIHPENYGSTFWTAPQADWHWPPIVAIDSAPYEVTTDASSFTLTSAPVRDAAVEAVNDLVVVKRFSADVQRDALCVDYTVLNQGRAPKRLAPWEITRVAPGGLTFFAADVSPSGPKQPRFLREAGCTWYQDHDEVEHGSKLFSEGKGWIAHVTPDGLLLLKTFPGVGAGAAAPGEAELEVYASNLEGVRYVEVENQGSYEVLAPGAATTWSVRWFLRELPAHVSRSAGNSELVAFVQQLTR